MTQAFYLACKLPNPFVADVAAKPAKPAPTKATPKPRKAAPKGGKR